MITITRALEALEAAVARKGEDYVYDGPCYYVRPNDAGEVTRCIVGEVLISELEVFTDADFLPGGAMAARNVYIVHSLSLPECEPGVVQVLRAAQAVQDTHGTWGEALNNARETAKWLREAVA